MLSSFGGDQYAPAGGPRLLLRLIEEYERRVEVEADGQHPLKGKLPGPGDICLRSNDYLALTADPRILNAEIAALRTLGHGDVSARIWSHDREGPLRRFERKLAAAMDAEDAVLCSAGYTANSGLIQSLLKHAPPLYIDMCAHMSFWQGAQAAGQPPRPFRHNSADHAERLIRKNGPGVVVVDALYSTDGALCPVRDFVELAESTGCILVVDETHSFGTIGATGGGLCDELGLSSRVQFRTLGLSKAVPSRGGAVVCSARAAEYVRNSVLPLIFSTSVLPHEAAGYSAILDILASDAWRRRKLHANHAYLRRGLDALGYNVDTSDAQIIALEAGELRQTIVLRDALEARGIFGAIFFPPATPEHRCLIRLSLNCALSSDQLDVVLRVCKEIRAEVGMTRWRSTSRRRGLDAQRDAPAVSAA